MTRTKTTARNISPSGFLLAALVTVGLALWAIAAAQEGNAAATTEASVITKLMVANNAEYGDYVTDGAGRAVYLFTKDTSGVSTCTDSCAANWPAVLVETGADMASLVAGTDIDPALLGTVPMDETTAQLTLNGWPLYYYAADTQANAVGGQGVNDVWYLVTPAGVGVGVDASAVGGAAAPK